MKYYLVDEISVDDMERALLFLRENGTISGLENVFWIRVPEEYLTETQSGHMGCRPYFFAVEVGGGMIKAEFFIRTLKAMTCSCNGYPDPGQVRYIIRYVDNMIEKLDIRT